MFQTTKIQTFESNSQHEDPNGRTQRGCFRLQRYKLLKAIHNDQVEIDLPEYVVSDYKDTNFWKQFTTGGMLVSVRAVLFQTTKIQTFESNSQPLLILLKLFAVVSDYKDTNFWKQFTTIASW